MIAQCADTDTALEKDEACRMSGNDSARCSTRSSRSANASTKTSGGS